MTAALDNSPLFAGTKFRKATAAQVEPSVPRRDIVLDLFSAVLGLRALRLLPSPRGGKSLSEHVLILYSAHQSSDTDLGRVKPLLQAVLQHSDDDVAFWAQIYKAFLETTPLPPLSSLILNSSEFRRDIDPILKNELGDPRVGIKRFREAFFACEPGLEAAAAAVFNRCCEGSDPAREGDVLAWFGNIIPKLEEFAAHHQPANLKMTHRRKLLAQPRTPLLGSTGRRSMDIGFVNDDFMFQPELGRAGRYRWSHILVPGELKSNPIADAPAVAWIDLATYAREVLSAQDTRRFVLAFTPCGSNLRLWEYDRLGGIASEQFNINEPKGGLEFVATILGFLWIDEEGLGFDPTIKTSQDTHQRFIEIERDGKPERLIIDEKAHREDDPLETPLVIKDSWQYTERDEEGLLVKEATEMGVSNIVRYYHHQTVQVGGVEDELRGSNSQSNNNRGGNGSNSNSNSNSGGTGSSAGTKRGLDEADLVTAAAERPAKRSQSGSAGSSDANKPLANRVHRRVILQDYGKPLYTASSPAALLVALESCIRGHESLRQHGFLHRDISINNLVIDEDGAPDRKGFLMNLDLAIREQRIKGSESKGKTGTRAFMAIGVLLGERHSFMHDLESFFWVLFWTCVHYKAPNKAIKTEFDEWNHAKDDNLAGMKVLLTLSSERFCKRAEAIFTPFYAPLIPVMDRLRAVVFPDGKPWEQINEGLYSAMREILLQGNE
ncbi:serine/threonine-protein kinase Sgk2 [Trichoderma austrokoningii]